MNLKISIETPYWYDRDNPEWGVELIKECGFEAVDLDLSNHFKDTYDKETGTTFFDNDLQTVCDFYKRLKNSMEKNGLTFAQSHAIYPIYYQENELKNESIIRAAERMLELCQYLGCPAIVFHPWTGVDISKDEEIEINLNLYRRLIPAAKKTGVKICLENLFGRKGIVCIEGACADAKEAVWYIDTLNAEAGEEVFGFCLDTGHANVLGKNLYQYISILGKRLTILHINDNMGSDDNHMIPYTQLDRQGTKTAIDWDCFIRGLKEIGYEGDLSFETFRGLAMLPREVRKEGFCLISAIGRYMREKILE